MPKSMAPKFFSSMTLASSRSIPTTPQLLAGTPITSSTGSSSVFTGEIQLPMNAAKEPAQNAHLPAFWPVLVTQRTNEVMSGLKYT
jgi:hypothetical protein